MRSALCADPQLCSTAALVFKVAFLSSVVRPEVGFETFSSPIGSHSDSHCLGCTRPCAGGKTDCVEGPAAGGVARFGQERPADHFQLPARGRSEDLRFAHLRDRHVYRRHSSFRPAAAQDLASRLAALQNRLHRTDLAIRKRRQVFGNKWSGREDSNLRPPGPEPGALPG